MTQGQIQVWVDLTLPLPLLTAKSCKFSLFWGYISQFPPNFDTQPPELFANPGSSPVTPHLSKLIQMLQLKKGSKILIVFFIIFWMFSSVIYKSPQLQSPPFGCAASHIYRINPRLPKVFSVTHFPKWGGYHPLWTWNWHAQSMIEWYHSMRRVPPFHWYQNFEKSANVSRHNEVFKHGQPQNADFQGNIGQNWIFHQKSSKYRNFTRFLLIKEGNGVSNMFCKFQDNIMKIFFKMAT